MLKPEKRAAGPVEIRAAGENSVRQIVGYAAKFGLNANIGGYFIERIAPGAFAGALSRPDDVRALFDHSTKYVLGRTSSGTLALVEDEIGLRYEVTPPDASWARDLTVSIERGDISQSSFTFRALREEWDETGELPVRTLLEVELFDVSPVTFPAYDDTEVGVRSLEQFREARGLALPSADALKNRAFRDLAQRQLSRLG